MIEFNPLILLVAVGIVGGILLVLITMVRPRKKALNRQRFETVWSEIETNMGDTNSSMQFAILQADKLLDKALKESGYKGQTMGERMTSASRVFSKPDEVWAAHKLRNRIAHESDVRVSFKITKRVLGCYKKALRDVGAL